MNKASTLDGYERRANQFFANTIKLPYKGNPWKPRTYEPKEYQGEPMDIGRLDPQEEKRRRDNNLCFSCGKPGHISADCRSKGSTSQRRDERTPHQPRKQNFGNKRGGKPQSKQVRSIKPEEGSSKADKTRAAIRRIISDNYQDEESEDYLHFIKQVNEMGF